MEKSGKATSQPVEEKIKPLTGGSLEDLFARAMADSRLIEGGKERGLPPVDDWHPEYCGDIDMEIKADGSWYYMGTPISRPAMVRLFSTVLRKDEDGKTYLVTPVEKIGIRVEDAHFVAVEMHVTGEGRKQQIVFRTNLGDVIEVSEKNPLRFEIDAKNNGLKPYILVRGRLEALVSRSVMYDLVMLAQDIELTQETELAQEAEVVQESEGQTGSGMVIYSGGVGFTLPV